MFRAKEMTYRRQAFSRLLSPSRISKKKLAGRSRVFSRNSSAGQGPSERRGAWRRPHGEALVPWGIALFCRQPPSPKSLLRRRSGVRIHDWQFGANYLLIVPCENLTTGVGRVSPG